MNEQFQLIDKHQRRLKKLRVSLLDECNMRCLYCMPEHPIFLAKNKLLSSNQIFEICSNLVNLGISEIRLTGGEPLLRPDFVTITEKLSTLSLTKLAVTTNGLKLKNILPYISSSNLKHINISIDSLDAKNFHKITKSDGLHLVLDAVLSAKKLGINVKVNTVLLRGVNDHEIEAFINFSKEHDINVRFLEAMKIGTMINDHNKYFLPASEIIDQIKLSHKMTITKDSKDSTSFNFNLNNGAKIGFIASESKSFCGECSRLRLGATGILYPCLFVDNGASLKDIPFTEYPYIIEKLIEKKPIERVLQIEKPMYAIGG
jgi:cyclic pyranopterin phosphate synthase